VTLSKAQLVEHLHASHDPTYSFAARAGKAAIDRDHRHYHARLDCDHDHDPVTGRAVPAGAVLPGLGR
jgi:hypothetical protein